MSLRTSLRCLAVASLCGWASACVDPNDPAKFKAPTDDGPKATEGERGAEPVALTAAMMPLPEDFEDEVTEGITADNYEQALQTLEAELAE